MSRSVAEVVREYNEGKEARYEIVQRALQERGDTRVVVSQRTLAWLVAAADPSTSYLIFGAQGKREVADALATGTALLDTPVEHALLHLADVEDRFSADWQEAKDAEQAEPDADARRPLP